MALVFAPGALSRDHGPGTTGPTFTGQESAQDARVGESPLEYPAGPKDPLRLPEPDSE